MEELKRLIEQEKEALNKGKGFHQQIIGVEKCIHRLHWAERQRSLLHVLYDLELKIEARAKYLLDQNKGNSEFINELMDIFTERVVRIINHLQGEKACWPKICENMQKEIDADIKEYRQVIESLKIKRMIYV